MRAKLLACVLTLFALQACILVASAQSPPQVNTNQPVATPAPASSGAESKPGGTAGSERAARLREGFKLVAEGSRELTGWSLAIIAASVLAIMSTSYFRPPNRAVRAAYLLFIPTWILFAVSIYKGNLVTSGCISIALGRDEVIDTVGRTISPDYASQIFYLEVGLLFFSIWLILFLLWWVFGNHPASAGTNQ